MRTNYKIDTVVEDVYKMMEDKEYVGDDKYLKKIADRVGVEVSEAIVNALSPREEHNRLRMSGIGRCERAQWYGIKGYDSEKPTGDVYITFLQGHIMEAILLGLVELSGHKVEGQQGKHTLEGVNGSQDCIIDGELVDVKTASAWSYDKKFAPDGIKDDAFGYIKQLSAYGKSDDRDSAYFLVFNKNKSTLKLSKQKLEKDIDKHIIQLKDKMELGTPPMRLADATKTVNHNAGGSSTQLNMKCAFCSYKESCFDKIDTITTSNGFTNYYDGEYQGPGSNFANKKSGNY